MCEKYDKNFSDHAEKYISYSGPTIQDEIISIIGQITVEEIVKEVKLCGFFPIMVDETRCFKEEQLAITVRFAKDFEF